MKKTDFLGAYDEAELAMLTDYIRREVSPVDWANEEPSSLMISAKDLVQVAMELAWYRGLNAMDAIEGGIAYFASTHLGREGMRYEVQLIEKPGLPREWRLYTYKARLI
jgi:hypothetical protein